MKKTVLLFFCAGLTMAGVSCGGSANSTEEEQNLALLTEMNDSLMAVNAEKDSLISLVREINEGVQQIKDVEKILNSSSYSSEAGVGQKAELKSDLEAIKSTLESRRKRIAALEEKLRKSSAYTTDIEGTIASLKQQVNDQAVTIQELQTELNKANERIGGLTVQVDSLTTVSDQERQLKEEAQSEAARLTTELYTCYYAIGTKSELKDNNIIQTGFLRSTKVMEGNYDTSYFTKADKRELTQLQLHSKKAEVMTNHPESSYTIDTDDEGMKVLNITDTETFWQTTSYLVVKIN